LDRDIPKVTFLAVARYPKNQAHRIPGWYNAVYCRLCTNHAITHC